jgi:hypothetical protein
MKDEEGDDGAGDQLRVVVLGDIGRRGVTEREEKTNAPGGTAGAGGKQGKEQPGSDWLSVQGHAGESGDSQHNSRKDGEALGGFSLGENAGPDHVDGEAGDAHKARGVTDPIALTGGTEGIDGHHNAGKADGDGQCFAKTGVLVKEDGGENGDDRGRQEDKDIEERERNVAQGDDDAEVVGEV